MSSTATATPVSRRVSRDLATIELEFRAHRTAMHSDPWVKRRSEALGRAAARIDEAVPGTGAAAHLHGLSEAVLENRDGVITYSPGEAVVHVDAPLGTVVMMISPDCTSGEAAANLGAALAVGNRVAVGLFDEPDRPTTEVLSALLGEFGDDDLWLLDAPASWSHIGSDRDLAVVVPGHVTVGETRPRRYPSEARSAESRRLLLDLYTRPITIVVPIRLAGATAPL
ncbi:hypothetical protein [Herbiconiux ginsengi]|uniref:Aldehyde dehydrogenase family protein n=1 Tax=Herbiconiux ginsengi TaxID=381665 RepID=A0A1H3SY29_9MICO|nr:hypothetical protein [Herbiconiux ginsengi]SDZ42538.1 hypothetical protein SAMN05216554_3787 [Herbiconiux ginsengi]